MIPPLAAKKEIAPPASCASGLTPPELRRVRELTQEHASTFVERWHEVFDR